MSIVSNRFGTLHRWLCHRCHHGGMWHPTIEAVHMEYARHQCIAGGAG